MLESEWFAVGGRFLDFFGLFNFSGLYWEILKEVAVGGGRSKKDIVKWWLLILFSSLQTVGRRPSYTRPPEQLLCQISNTRLLCVNPAPLSAPPSRSIPPACQHFLENASLAV